MANGAHSLVGGWVDDLRRACGFLTRLPVGAIAPVDGGSLADASRAFPLVGLIVGLAGGLVYLIATGLGVPALPAAVLAVAGQAGLTGALHEDGLADLADGLAGGGTIERRLEIMRDSRIGAVGAVALILLLAGRVTAIAELASPGLAVAALMAAGAVSRAGIVWLMALVPAARMNGLGAAAGAPTHDRAWMASAIAAVAALLLLDLGSGIVALALAAAAAAAVGLLARRQLGGVTGDVLGAAQQLSELACLLTAAALLA